MIPQQTPVNQNKKTGALQNACPKFISRPQTQSSYKFVSYRMVGLEICLTVLLCLTCTCPTFPGKPRRFLQNGMVDQKKILTKCLRLLQTCPWNGTWVKPFHSGNTHRDRFLGYNLQLSVWLMGNGI